MDVSYYLPKWRDSGLFGGECFSALSKMLAEDTKNLLNLGPKSGRN